MTGAPPARLSAPETGQSTVELLGGGAALLLAGLVALQLLAAGYGAVMADHAAEAAALALVNGRPPAQAAARAVPGWPSRAASVRVVGARVHVRLEPPSAFGVLRGRLASHGEAAVAIDPSASPGR